jgi:hypothetical protein
MTVREIMIATSIMEAITFMALGMIVGYVVLLLILMAQNKCPIPSDPTSKKL